MSTNQISLPGSDDKAYDWIRENLEVCAWDRKLSRKLLERYAIAGGSIIAFIPDWVKVDQLETYAQGSLPPDHSPYPKGESPLDGLVSFVAEYLQSTKDSLVLCDNSEVAHKTLEIWTWSRPPRFATHGDSEVLYILDPSDIDREMIDGALADSLNQWGAVVCSL